MTKSRYVAVGLISFLVVAILSSPIAISESGLNMAFASAEQTAGPEGPQNEVKVSDPNEQLNRKVFEFNDRLYFYVLKPVAVGYSAVVPKELREALSNGFHNLVFPSRFINFVLQGKADKAANEAMRFVINSTLGMAGLIDIAQIRFKLDNHESDFGQTLGVWGVGPGVFLMVPVLGPSNPRDFLGFGADSVMDPLFWFPVQWWESITAESGKFINRTSLHIGEYEEMKKASLDPYIAMRDAYIQYRAHFIAEK